MADIMVADGNLLVNADGDLATDCGGGIECDYPTIIVSVTGNTSDVTWCGETWTSEQSGESREICPSLYTRKAGTHEDTLYEPPYIYTEYTHYSTNVWDDGSLKMRASKTTHTTFHDAVQWGSGKSLEIGINNAKDHFVRLSLTQTLTLDSDVGVLVEAGWGGLISNGYFGSYTDDNGVTYSWSKGSGWDF